MSNIGNSLRAMETKAMAPLLAELKAKKAEVMKEIREHGQAALVGAFKEFFAANPQIAAIRWKQYTPHFNDGEACEFGVRGFRFKLADGVEDPCFIDRYGDDDESEVFVEPSTRRYNKATKKGEDVPKTALYEACQSFARDVRDEDIYELSFGDHAEVTATREGFSVEEYDHD